MDAIATALSKMSRQVRKNEPPRNHLMRRHRLIEGELGYWSSFSGGGKQCELLRFHINIFFIKTSPLAAMCLLTGKEIDSPAPA